LISQRDYRFITDSALALGVGRIDFGFGGSSTDKVLTTMKQLGDEVLARI